MTSDIFSRASAARMGLLCMSWASAPKSDRGATVVCRGFSRFRCRRAGSGRSQRGWRHRHGGGGGGGAPPGGGGRGCLRSTRRVCRGRPRRPSRRARILFRAFHRHIGGARAAPMKAAAPNGHETKDVRSRRAGGGRDGSRHVFFPKTAEHEIRLPQQRRSSLDHLHITVRFRRRGPRRAEAIGPG